MKKSRREFLKSLCAYAGGSVIAQGLWGAGTEEGLAYAQGLSCANPHKVVVSIFLSGGPHGPSILIPSGLQSYMDKHPTLRIINGLSLDANHALHPNMPGIHALYQQGKVAIMNGGGYPNHSRSHEDSTNYMGRAIVGAQPDTTGWGGRFAKNNCSSAELFSLFSFRGKIAEVSAPGVTAPTASSLSSYNYTNDGQGTPANNYVRQLTREARMQNEFVNPHQAEMLEAWEAGDDALQTIQQVNTGYTAGVTYPNTGIAQRLRDAAKLIVSPLISPRMIFASHGGFDTHGNQAATLNNLLGQLDGAVTAFWADMVARGRDNDVVILFYGEFGRTNENATAGTDHGTGTLVGLVGNSVRGGVVVPYAESDFLSKNSPWVPVKFDYREVLEQIITGHLGADPVPILPQAFNRVGMDLFF